MSLLHNQRFQRWKDVESRIRCTSFSRRSTSLSYKNNILTQDAIMLTYLVWEDTLTLSGQKPVPRDLPTRWLNAILLSDLENIVSLFKEADSLLLQIIEEDLDYTYDDFKHHLKGFPMMGTILSPLKGRIEHITSRENDMVLCFREAHQCLTFIGRLNLHGLDDLQEEALVLYLANLERVRSHDVFTQVEKDLIVRWFPRKRINEIYSAFFPKHGNGAVAESGVKSVYDKYMVQTSDDLLKYIDRKTEDRGTGCTPDPRPTDRCCKLQFVPKSVSRLRSIAMEPATLQYYQQGFLSSIKTYLEEHPYLKRRIDLSHGQERNCSLAKKGSISGSYSTIDLSMASDSVSLALIRDWFRESCLYPGMICTRSQRVLLPGGDEIPLPLFASMGSALCFPIECIVFAAITEAGILSAGGDPRISNFSIYGDDIVVETAYAPFVVERLRENGFIPNQDKTFSGTGRSLFRESCGGEFLDGVDVTPIRLSRFFSGYSSRSDNTNKGINVTSAQFASLVDLCNRTYERLPHVREFLIKELLQLPRSFRPLFVPQGESGGITTCDPTNYQLRARYQYGPGTTYSTLYYHGIAACKRVRNREEHESVRLFETLRLLERRPYSSFNPLRIEENRELTVSKPPLPSIRKGLTIDTWSC